LKRVIIGDTEIKEFSEIEELTGKLASDPETQRLMRSVLDNDKETIDEGRLIRDAINQGLNSFTPDMLFEQLVRDYKVAKQLYGETMLREATGYEPGYLERNIRIPEFRRELKKKLDKLSERLVSKKLSSKEGDFTEKAIKLASIILYAEEADKLLRGGITTTEKSRKAVNESGIKDSIKGFSKERYRDIAIRKSLHRAIRRGRIELDGKDLLSFERKQYEERQIIYCLDASGSMKGEKLGQCKKAGIALAYKAIDEKDKVGLVVFNTDVLKKIQPTSDFDSLLKEMVRIKASAQTDIAATIRAAAELFTRREATRHIILITDAIPTKGSDPEKDALSAAAESAYSGITISVVGINLDGKGKEIAEKIAELGKGRVFIARNTEELDSIVLEDYTAL
jgi:Mg-chelatase subunit ChlD